jgi:diguanylate cyclase (GGDEF)-like protein/putative nucleotidyltransferase with HDIG domain
VNTANFKNLNLAAKISLGALLLLAPAVIAGAALANLLLAALALVFAAVTGFTLFSLLRADQAPVEQTKPETFDNDSIHLATVQALATAIDARDQVAHGHIRRMQFFAVGIGEALNLPANDIEALRAGALLHDIGKLAIPDHILNKPGQLTPAEMEKVRNHSNVGAMILEGINFPYPVVPAIRHHHESWDGTGYPDKLRGYDIPVTARILAIADSYDSMRTDRKHNRAITREEARRILQAAAGTKYDPKLVDAFLRNLNRFEADLAAQGLAYSEASEGEYVENKNDAGGIETYVEFIKNANKEVTVLYEMTKVFSSSLSLKGTLELFARRIKELVPFDTCIVYLTESQKSAYAAYIEGKNADVLKGHRLNFGEGATGFALEKRRPVSDADPLMDFPKFYSQLAEEYHAMVSLPLIVNDRVLGAVSLYSSAFDKYENEHVRLLENVSHIAADAVFKSLSQAEAESRAMTDPMTGLPNARSLQAHFEKEVARSKRAGTAFQVLMLDLDGFKAVNDNFGHKIGDRLLKEVGHILRRQLRDYDFLARYAGDEYVAVVPELSDQGISELCRRMEKAIFDFRMPIGDGVAVKVGVSIGASAFPRNGETLDQLIAAADNMMYSVKASHKEKGRDAVLEVAPGGKNSAKASSADILTAADGIVTISEDEILPDLLIVELDESSIISSDSIQ